MGAKAMKKKELQWTHIKIDQCAILNP
ncbi:uncharacterized protein G2W53_034971 [Senna tora]|uniref:Uncharacterized protein n=1 Tax=Senna tora TaxID=362788 RepID=A0A834SS17_9FABA|nr:uncharacterized protein G2W53_034971 [Senna tora]